MSAQQDKQPRTTGPGYETRDVSFRPVLWASLGLALAVVVFSIAMWALMQTLAAREERAGASDRPLAAGLRRDVPPAPRLQTTPIEDLTALRQWEEGILTSYAWVDRRAGVVRVPMDRAIELLAERGMPAGKGGER